MSEPEAPLNNFSLDFSTVDPVCGMTIDSLQARGKAQYRDDTYFFCSPGCMQKFMASPATYVPTSKGKTQPAASPSPVPSSRK